MKETTLQMQPEMVDKNKFLDFSTAKVQVLTMEQLERTHNENDVYGRPLRGIYHHDFNAATDLYKANSMNTSLILFQNIALVETLDSIYHFAA